MSKESLESLVASDVSVQPLQAFLIQKILQSGGFLDPGLLQAIGPIEGLTVEMSDGSIGITVEFMNHLAQAIYAGRRLSRESLGLRQPSVSTEDQIQ